MTRRKLLFLLPAGIMFLWIALTAQSVAGGEDGVLHYLYARYAPNHPGNFLNHWAKPLFVLLACPFAQFGLLGVQVFNILLAVATAWLVWKTAEELALSPAWLAPVLLVFATIYFYTVPSGLTEILFGFLLAFAIYLACRRQYMWMAILVSFLPFARSEGNGIILVFAIGLISLRQWKALPWLLAGTLLYSLAGWPYYGDLFWIWTQHPYTDASDIYGSGSFFGFVKNNKAIWGNPLYLFWILGTALFLYDIVRRLFKKKWPDRVWLFFIFGSAYTYLIGHSLMWALGKSGSLGLIRVMAAVMPPTALIALYGFDRLSKALGRRANVISPVLAGILSIALVVTAFDMYTPPFEPDREKMEIQKMAAWYKQSELAREKPKIYFHAPSIAEALGIDPFDPAQSGPLAYINDGLEPGSLVVWDAHFGPNECRLPLEKILARNDLKLVYHQVPDRTIKTLNGYNYEILIFRTHEKH